MNASATGRDPAPCPRAPADARVTVDVVDATASLGAGTVDWLAGWTRKAVEALAGTGEVRVRIVGDSEMAVLHGRFSQDPTTTDVLTFDLTDGSAGPLDVDLYVCADVARRAAKARGHGPERELLLYVVHGVLHCLGHNDHDPDQAAAMHKREDEVLIALGVGAVYDAAEGTMGPSSVATTEGR